MVQQQLICKKKDEWYTPLDWIVLCKNFLDLENFNYDLASCFAANERIQAKQYYSVNPVKTLNNKGSFLEHFNNLEMYPDLINFWLNPPFSKVKQFTLILESLYKNSHNLRGFVLVNANTETMYFQLLISISKFVLLPNKRINFYDPYEEKLIKGNPKGQAIFYIDNFSKLNTLFLIEKAKKVFKDKGAVLIC